MACRAVIGVLLAAAVLVVGAPAGAGERTPTSGGYHVVRPDPRLCPSPMCGGVWVERVNSVGTVCGDGAARNECYAAAVDRGALRVDENRRARLQGLITEGRAVVRGKLVRGLVEGFPDLDTFVASEVWIASSSLRRALGTFHRLRDSGIRCVTTPCFSIRASLLNTSRLVNVSTVDLSRTGATRSERLKALGSVTSGPGVLASGRVRRAPDGGPTFVATQFYVRG